MKRILWTLITLLALSTVLILVLPTIASTNIGKKVIKSAISQRIQGNVDIGSWELSWFGPQVIRNIKFKNNEVEFNFSELHAKLPFWAFMTVTQLKESFLNELEGTASLKNGNIILYDKNGSTTYVENIDINLYGDEGEEAHFDLKGNSRVGQITGSILIDGKITKTSNITDSPFSNTVKIITANFPTKSIGKLFQIFKIKSNNKLLKILKKDPNFLFSTLGPKVNANLLIRDKDNERSVALEMVSTNLKMNLDGSIKDNKIYLNKNLYVTCFPSNSSDNKLIESLSPLFAPSLQVNSPITLTVFKDGFVSSYDMNIKDLKIPKATLDVGKIKCKNTKTLSTVISLFKPQKLEEISDVSIWCTPLTFEIRDRMLIAGRMDTLIADTIHIYLYGDINLTNDKIDMILGISTDTLEEMLKIKNIPSDYVFQIPVKGKLDNPKINLSRTESKLATLIASEKKSEKIPEIPELLDILEEVDEKKPPPPCQRFPWQKERLEITQ